jgi:hypothetical protein
MTRDQEKRMTPRAQKPGPQPDRSRGSPR